MKINITHLLDRFIWVSVVIFLVLSMTISFALEENSRLGGVILLGVLAITFILYLLREKGKIYFKWTIIHSYMTVFILVCIISSLLADNPGIAFARTFDIVKMFLMIIIWMLCYPNGRYIDRLLKAYMWANYIVCFYVLYVYGFNVIDMIIISNLRIDNDLLNANTLGLAAAHALVITAYYIYYEKFRIWYCIPIFPTILMLLVSGSKKAIIFFVVSLFALYIFKNYKSSGFTMRVLKIGFKLICFLVLLFIILQLPIFNGLTERFDSLMAALDGGVGADHSSVVRLDLISIGWSLFFKAPILGVGINNPQLYTYFTYGIDGFYLHNNYMELLAGIGIIGFIAYYWIYVYIGYNYIKHVNFKNKIYIITSIIFWINIFMDIGEVTYETKMTYFLLMIYYLVMKDVLSTDSRRNGV